MDTQRTLRATVSLAISLAISLAPWSVPLAAAATSTQPQVVIAIGNSESMDGTLSGAIMTGSGSVTSDLYNTSSPPNYNIPSAFTPPVTGPTTSASAPYTASLTSGVLADNGPSRLNVAKAGLIQVLRQYLGGFNFALEDYSTGTPALDSTWVYYMSPSDGFHFSESLPTNGYLDYAGYQAALTTSPLASPAPTRWTLNPCYQYRNMSSTSQVAAYCANIVSAGLYSADTLSDDKYMQIAASSDDPNINDVLYASGLPPVYIDYQGVYNAYYTDPNTGLYNIQLNGSPQNPYPPNPPNSSVSTESYFTLQQYEAGTVSIGYNQSTGWGYGDSTGPTNAGYVPYSPQVMYALRGFGYNASESYSGGNVVVPMTSLPNSFSTTQYNAALSAFQSALQPETNSTSSTEIKSSAGQAATAGLIKGAAGAFTAASCGKFVILVTDGLPTVDLSGNNWPPLGSAAGQGYGVYAAFYGQGSSTSQASYGVVDDSKNLPTGTTAGTLDVANSNDQALIDTIQQIQSLAAQGITTYVVGLGAGVDPSVNPAARYALQAMALAGVVPGSNIAGTGVVYPASNVAGFENALQQIATSISGSVIAASPAVPTFVENGSLAYLLTSDSIVNQQHGNLEAFSTDANGNVSTTPAWTLQMTAAQRQTDLLTDAGNNSVVQSLAGTSATAFGSPTSPTASTIIQYTIDPSYGGGAYLAGRASGSFLGTITSQADKPVILSAPNNPNFIGSGTYATYAKNNACRTPLVLFTSDDGFLYAVTAGSANSSCPTVPGTLQWAWMPKVFLPQLQYYTQFQGMHLMNGGMTTVDSADASGNWATYVVGTAQGGALHYDLKLNGCSSSSSACTPTIAKVWYDEQSNATSPPQAAPQAPSIWWDTNNVAYAAYFTVVGNTSYLNVMRLYDGSTSKVSLSFTPSSAAYLDPAAQTLYVGDTAGNVWSFDLSTGPTASKVIGPTLVGTAPNETAGAGAIRYLGLAQTSSGLYLWATQDHQAEAFKFTGGSITANIPGWTNTSGWTLWWWSGIGGSGYFVPAANGGGSTLTLTQDPGVNSTTQPYWLDAGSTITDQSTVQAATLIVPVTVLPTSSCGVPQAKYDFFDLASGSFPQNKFYDLNKNALTSNPIIGIGTAFAPAISQNGNGSSIVYGTASQNLQGKIGFQVAATSGIHVGPGVVGWQPLWLTQP